MATLYISEYARQARDISGNPVPVGQEPALAIQTVAITAGSVASAAFHATTSLFGFTPERDLLGNLWADADRTTANARMAAGQTRVLGFRARWR